MKKLFYKRKRGSAILSILLISLMITSLVVTVITLSLRNLQMASKNMKSNYKYYEVDKVTQDVVTFLEQTLAEVDSKTTDYISNGRYKTEALTDSSIVDALMATGNHKMIYDKWKNDVSILNPQSEKYNEELSKYIDGVQGRIWGSMIEKAFQDIQITLNEKFENKAFVKLQFKSGHSFKDADSYAEWDKYAYDNVDQKISLRIYDSGNVDEIKIPTGTRYIECELIPERAIYDNASRKKVKNNGVKTNPIWSNAITAKDIVTINNCNVNVYGDIVDVASSGNSMAVTNGNLRIYGNVFLAGNLNINNSTVTLNRYDSSITYPYKNHLYETKTYAELTGLSDTDLSNMNQNIYQAIEGIKYNNDQDPSIAPAALFLLPDDSKGGNLYMNTLNGNNSTINNNIMNIAGNITTKGTVSSVKVNTVSGSDKSVIAINETIYNNARPLTNSTIINNLNTNYSAFGKRVIVPATNNFLGNLYAFPKYVKVFDKKTKYLGFNLNEPDVFNNYMDKNKITKGLSDIATAPTVIKVDNGILDLSDNNSLKNKNLKGIVYSPKDLTITGNGSFSGAIICEGKVTFSNANVTINYDEKVIKDIVASKENPIDSREYFDSIFKKGEKGRTLIIDGINNEEINYSKNPESSVCIKREGFKINSWSQKVK